MTYFCAKCSGNGLVYVELDAVATCPACQGDGTSGRHANPTGPPSPEQIENMARVARGMLDALDHPHREPGQDDEPEPKESIPCTH